jgi:hypothetical protein
MKKGRTMVACAAAEAGKTSFTPIGLTKVETIFYGSRKASGEIRENNAGRCCGRA